MRLSFARFVPSRLCTLVSPLLILLALPCSRVHAQISTQPVTGAATDPATIRTIAHAIKPAGLAIGAQNRVYFTSLNRVYRVSPGGNIELIAGNGQRGSLGDGGPAIAAQLNIASAPARASLAVDSAGNLYILDSGNETIRRIDVSTSVISTVVGRWAHSSVASNYAAVGDLAFAPAAGSDQSSHLFFISPSALVSSDLTTDTFAAITNLPAEIFRPQDSAPASITPAGAMALAVSPNAREIYVASSAGLFRLPIAADAGATSLVSAMPLLPLPVAADNSAPARASYAVPNYSLAFSPAGDLYISESAQNLIALINTRTRTVSPIATAARFNSPGAIAFDAAGNLFVADAGNDAIREITLAATGTVSLTPTRYPFPTQLIGGKTAPHQFVLTNNTSGTISGIAIQFAGGATPADFTQTNTCASQLGPGQSCDINVSFTPQATGQRIAVLSVTDSDPSSPQTAELTGLADDFSLQLQNGATDTLTVVSGGKATYQLQVASDGTFSGKVSVACPTNLPLYVTCTITPSSVTVTPGSPQNFTAVFQTTTRITAAPPTLPGVFRRDIFSMPAPIPTGAALNFLAAGLFASLFALCIIITFAGFSTPAAKRLFRPLLAAASLILVLSIAGCGSSSNTATSAAGPVGTAAGTYNFAITASAQNATRAISLTLTVQ